MKYSTTLLLACLIFFNFLLTSSKTQAATGFLDFNYYYDSRDFNELTINAFGQINDRVQYFSLTNYSNTLDEKDNFDVTQFYSEQNIRFKLLPNSFIDLVTQAALKSSEDNDKLRFGFRLRLTSLSWLKPLSKRFRFSVAFYPAQFDDIEGFNWQIEYVYSLVIIEDYLKLTGFLDHNILEAGDKTVTEHQLAFNIVGQLHVIAEYRLNQYFTSKQRGLGTGLEYKIIF